MKKIIALVLALVMVFALVACGKPAGGNSTPPASTPPASQPGTSTPPATEPGTEKPYKMVMEIINYGFNDPDLLKVQDEVNKITIPAIGVEVEFLPVPIMNMATKLGLMVAGNEQIDLTVTGLITTPARLVADGLLQPITQYVNESKLAELADGILEACTINGEIYCYPGSLSNGMQVKFLYDADLAAQYNITLPDRLDTPEKWDALFAQVKASGMPQYAISLGDGKKCEYEWAAFDALGDDSSCSYGVVMANGAPNTIVNYYATPEYQAKCEMHRDWFQKGYAVPDSSSNGYTTTDSMTQGMIFGYCSNIGVSMSEAYWTKTTGKNIASIPMTDMNTTSGNITNFSWGVSSTCERPDLAVKFLELMYTNADLANLMNNGIEGVHYVKNGDSMIVSYPEGVDAGSCGYGSFVGSYGDMRYVYQRAPLTDEFVESIPDFMYPTAACSPYLGYSFDTAPVAAEHAAVTAVIEQYAPALECGIVDPSEVIPEFLAALESAGMSKIVAENQAQLNAWLAK